IAPDEGGAGAERLASQAPTNRRERRHDRFSLAAGGGGGGGVEPLRGGSRNATRELAPEGFERRRGQRARQRARTREHGLGDGAERADDGVVHRGPPGPHAVSRSAA